MKFDCDSTRLVISFRNNAGLKKTTEVSTINLRQTILILNTGNRQHLPSTLIFNMILSQRNTSFLFLLVAFFLGACNILPFASAANQLGKRTSDLPLFATSVTHCDDMIYLHRWEGDCCSLNVTQGNGCILNVMNGYCKVYGQEWTLEYTSTYDERDCPNSEYTPDMLGIKTVDEPESDSSSSSIVTSIGTSLLGGFTAFVLFG